MTFAEEKTYKYIRDNHSKFCCVDVLEILPFLSCLTASDQDRLRASYTQVGNRDTLWELFNRLQRRTGWVGCFIQALMMCEFPELAQQVTQVYQSYLPSGTQPCSLAPPESPVVPAKILGTFASAPGYSIPHSGYQGKPGYPRPVQDTQPPKSPGENSEQAPQVPSFGAVLKMSGDSLMPSSDQQALSSLTSSEHHEQEPEFGGAHRTGVASTPISPHGPVSPTVSFQPLARSTPRASHLFGPMVSVAPADTSPSSSSTGLASVRAADDQAKAAICPSAEGVPTNSLTISSVPSPTNVVPVKTMSSKVSAHSALVSTVPSKLPTSSDHPVPSKLPINLARAGTIPSRVLTKTPETLEAPANTVTTGYSLPRPDSNSRSLYSGPELSKPGILVSEVNSQPFSGCSADLAISPSSSLGSEPNHGPEENEYLSFRIQVEEGPNADLLVGSSGPLANQQPPEEEEEEKEEAQWLGAAGAALLALFLAVVLYRGRHLAQ
uniref:Mitochondrial antiviral-signaling protein n=1 Tax=Nannospalax galili TaxID=1026970 RepID=A0A8C6W545_NANGA